MKILTSEKNIFSDIETKQLLFLFKNRISNEKYDSLLLSELITRYFKENRFFNLYDLYDLRRKDDYKIFYFLVELELTQETVNIPDEHIVSFLKKLLEIVVLLKENLKKTGSTMDWTFEKLIGLEDLLNKFKTLKVRKPEFVRQLNDLIEEINMVRNKLKEVLIIKNKEKSLEVINKNIALRELKVLKIPVSQLKQADWEKAIENINLYEKNIQLKLLKRVKTFKDISVLNKNPAHVLGIVLTNFDEFYLSEQKKSETNSNIDLLNLFNQGLFKYETLEKYMPINNYYFQIIDIMKKASQRVRTILPQKNSISSKTHYSYVFSESILFNFKLYLLEKILLKLPQSHPKYSFFKKEYYNLLFNKFYWLYKTIKNNKKTSLYDLIKHNHNKITYDFMLVFNKFNVSRYIHNENLFISSFYLFETMFINPVTSIKPSDSFIINKYSIIYKFLLTFLTNSFFDKKSLNSIINHDNIFFDIHENYCSLLNYRLKQKIFNKEEEFLFFKSTAGVFFLKSCNNDILKEIALYLKEIDLSVYDFSKKEDITTFFSLKSVLHRDVELLNLCLNKISKFYPNDYIIADNYFSIFNNEERRKTYILDYFLNKFC